MDLFVLTYRPEEDDDAYDGDFLLGTYFQLDLAQETAEKIAKKKYKGSDWRHIKEVNFQWREEGYTFKDNKRPSFDDDTFFIRKCVLNEPTENLWSGR